MTFGDLFQRAVPYDVNEDAVRSALRDRRAESGGERERGGDDEKSTAADSADASDPPDSADSADAPDPSEPSPARVVAVADVFAADLLVGGAARDGLDALRSHSWTTLVASDPLLDDAESVIASLADAELAADWRAAVEEWREPAVHPAGDHPALGSAYRGAAMQVVSLDPSLTGPGAAAGLRDRMPVSVREPRAFAVVFSPERLYPEVVDGEYPGPDRDPRSMRRSEPGADHHG